MKRKRTKFNYTREIAKETDVISMSDMFSGSQDTILDLSSFDTSKNRYKKLGYETEEIKE